ncbi:MAG TPA: peptidase inhibitor family I36 protein [Alloacidobacterium sp.]|nr:peptidase inhibitor family I36 protein [Alloacidobacterium sp.]
MKRLAAFLVLTFAVTVFAQYGPPPPPPGQQQPWVYGQNPQWNSSWNRWPNPHRGACFYTTAPYRGNRFCVRSGDRLPALPGNIGGNISSVQIFGGASVKLFNDRNFSNGSVTLRHSVSDLRNVPFRNGHTWNNRVSSIMVY